MIIQLNYPVTSLPYSRAMLPSHAASVAFLPFSVSHLRVKKAQEAVAVER